MKLFIITFCFMIRLSVSTPVEDVLSEKKLNLDSIQHAETQTVEFDILQPTNGIPTNSPKNLTHRLLEISQEVKNSELRFNDTYEAIKRWNLMLSENDLQSISDIKYEFESFATVFKTKFADLEIQSTNGGTDSVSFYESSDWTPDKINKLLETFTPAMQKVKLLNLLQGFNLSFIDRSTSKEKIVADNNQQEIKIISVDLSSDISSPYVRKLIKFFHAELAKSATVKYYIEDAGVSVPEVETYFKGNVKESVILSDVDMKEYFFLADYAGKVRIIDAMSYEQVTTYYLPGVSEFNITAIVDNKFYSIDVLNGTISSTDIENIMVGPSSISWTKDLTFPVKSSSVPNSAAVNETCIYFTTYDGVLNQYNITTKRLTTYSGMASISGLFYNFLIMVDEILYIHKYNHFYSFNGTDITEIATPETRFNSGLFQMDNNVCRVGGNVTNLYPDPVSCYSPASETWYNNTNYINQARRYPAVTVTKLRTYIFGGQFTGAPNNPWLNSIEAFDDKTNIWTYAPTPITSDQQYIKAHTFYF